MLRPAVSRPVCLGVKHPSEAYDQIFNYCQTVAGLLIWGTLPDERTCLTFKIVAGSRQRSHFRVQVSWDFWSYFTLSDSRHPFSSPPTTRRGTVEVFVPASTRDCRISLDLSCLITSRHGPRRSHRFPLFFYPIFAVETCLFEKPLLSNGCLCWINSSCLQQICHNIMSRYVIKNEKNLIGRRIIRGYIGAVGTLSD
jgi:hypothetical protein